MTSFNIDEIKNPQTALEEIGYWFGEDKYGLTVNDSNVYDTLSGAAYDDMTEAEIEEEQANQMALLDKVLEQGNWDWYASDGNKSFFKKA